MKVAFTAWEDKISPVFNSTRMLLIVDIDNTEIISRRYEAFNPKIIFCLADILINLKIDVLICGAISKIPARIIEDSGVNLIPFIGGNIEDILVSYVKEKRVISTFLMPGCNPKRNKTRNRNACLKNKKEDAMPKGNKGGGIQSQNTGKGGGRCKDGGGCQSGKGGRGTGQGAGRGTGQGAGRGTGQGAGRGTGQGAGQNSK